MINYLPYNSRKPDAQYKKALRQIYNSGYVQASRQGPPSTLQPKGVTMHYPLVNGFPFDTLRTLRGAFHLFVGELFWILSGDTSLELLHKYGVTYWDAWADDEHCARHGLQTGQFGATYGKQFRNFGGTHLGSGFFAQNGFDQLKYIVENLRRNPEWRRWFITPFNPQEYEIVDIVPCHGELFFVVANNKLHLHLIQRSGDFPIGVPSNQVMWGVFGEIIARLTNLEFVHLTHFVSNAHYYGDHRIALDDRHAGDQSRGVEIMLSREAKALPTVQISNTLIDAVKLMIDQNEIDPLSRKEINPEVLPYKDFLAQHVTLEDYNPGPFIPRELLPVSV